MTKGQDCISDYPKIQSQIIDALRYPLIILVLYMHIIPLEPKAIPQDLDAWTIYTYISELISHNFGLIAVPLFFLFSGYLFFCKAPKSIDRDFFSSQWKKRLKTLLIPYLLWNTINIIVVLIKGYGFRAIGLDGQGDIDFIYNLPLWRHYWDPIDLPLWYLRDLICMTAIAPLFYLAFRYLGHWTLLIIGALYLSNIEPFGLGFSMTAIMYFGIGAYFGINKLNLVKAFAPYGYWPFTISLIIFIIGTATYNVGPYRMFWIRPAVLLGVLGIFFVMSRAIQIGSIRDICLKYAGSVFFIYAVHELYLKNWIKGAFFRTPLADSGLGMIIGYILMPLLLLGICLVLNNLTKRYLPSVYGVLTGGRS